MTEDRIHNIVFEVIRSTIPDAQPHLLSPDEDMRSALNIDSFDFLQIIIALNEKHGIEVPESDYGKISTLRGMVGYLKGKSGGGSIQPVVKTGNFKGNLAEGEVLPSRGVGES